MRLKVSLNSTEARLWMTRRTLAMGPSGDLGADFGDGKLPPGPDGILDVFVEPTPSMCVLTASNCLLILTEPAPNHMLMPTIRLAAISLPAENTALLELDLRAALLMAKTSANA